MARKRKPYSFGSLISIIDDDQSELAICRVEGTKGSIVIGRFFLKYQRYESGRIKLLGESFVWQFSDLYIINGRWPVLGVDEDFTHDPSATFEFIYKGRPPAPLGYSRVDVYDVECNNIKSYRPAEGSDPNLPPSDLFGSEAVLISLRRVVDGTRHPHFQF